MPYYHGPPSLQYSAVSAVRFLKRVDPRMAELIKQVGAFKLQTEFAISPFQSLLRAIVFQQLAGSAARAIYARLQTLFPEPQRITPAQVLALPPEALRSAGLSRAKMAAVADLSHKCVAGLIPDHATLEQLSDEELIDCLCSVRGVGRWTAQIMMIYRLGRADILPAADLGIRKGYQLAYHQSELPSAKQLTAWCQHLSPYRSVASWYLWRATDSVNWDTLNA